MNREIKFRAWDNMGNVQKGSYCFVKKHPSNGREINQHTIHNGSFQEIIDISTLGQFTGLKDKNGKEIYEGDICVNPIYIDKITVYFGNEKSMGFNYSFHYANEVRSNKNEWEIIGNIHENPELL